MNNLKAAEFNALVLGGTILSANAGFINVITMTGLYTTTVSHLTGNASKLAIHLFNLEFTNFFLALAVILSFMMGSFCSAFMVGDSRFRLGRSYGLVLLVEAGALFMSFMLLKNEYVSGDIFAAFACGAQNAITTMYSGAIVRTTHMTGLVTDVGVVLGHMARPGMKAERWKLKVFIPLWLGFVFGGIVAKIFYKSMKEFSLLIPCFTVGIAAAVYISSEAVTDAQKALRRQLAEEEAKKSFEKEMEQASARKANEVDKEIQEFMQDLEPVTNAKLNKSADTESVRLRTVKANDQVPGDEIRSAESEGRNEFGDFEDAPLVANKFDFSTSK